MFYFLTGTLVAWVLVCDHAMQCIIICTHIDAHTYKDIVYIIYLKSDAMFGCVFPVMPAFSFLNNCGHNVYFSLHSAISPNIKAYAFTQITVNSFFF